MGNVKLFELCETIPEVQCSECLLYWNQGIVYCTCGHLLREINPADIFTDGNWVFSQFRTMSSRRCDLMAIVMVKLKHRGSTLSPTMQERDVSKRASKEFTIAFRKTRFRDNAKLIGLSNDWSKCVEMDELAQKDFTYRPSPEEYERFKKTWSISLNTSGRNAPMKLRTDFSETLKKMHRLHRESGEERLAPIPVYQYRKWHSSSSSSSTSWWQWNDHWWSS